MRRLIVAVLLSAFVLSLHAPLYAHCEIPCGIYGDDMRFAAITEDLTTIEKSMKMIVALSADSQTNMNQLVRWVKNKESHADRIREVVAQYFLAQRIKAPSTEDQAAYEDYTQKLVLLHQMIVTAMKCKQTTDLTHVKKLHDLLHKFQRLYEKK